MAKERNLPSKTTLTTSDYIRVVGSDNASYKQLVSDVADKIISSGYLVYGATSLPSNADLNTYRTAGVYTCSSGSVAQTLSNCPTTSAFRLEVKQILNADRYVQILYVNISTHPTLYWRTYNGSWSSWYAPALKAQMDELNSKTALTLQYTSNSYVSSSSFNLCAATKIGNVLLLKVNVTVDNFPSGASYDGTEIGRVSGWSASTATNVCLAPQSGTDSNGILLLAVSAAGVVTMSNRSGKSCNGFYRATVISA